MSALVMRAARQHFNHFVDELEILRGQISIDQPDREALLQLGIDAFDWLLRADQTMRESIYAGQVEHDPKLESALEALLRGWAQSSEIVKEWLRNHPPGEGSPTNSDRFHECARQAISMIRALQSKESDALNDALRDLRDAAVTEHGRGETAEFV